MPQFVLECTEHTEAQCDEMSQEMEREGVAEVLKGREFLCSCPHGHHAGWAVVEGSDADSILATLPPIFRAHARAHQIESMQF